MYMSMLVLTFVMAIPPGMATDSTRADTVHRVSTDIMLLPIIFSSPDTRLAFGVLPQLVFRTHDSDYPSTLRLDSYYTLNKQYHILLRPSLWLNQNRWNLSGKFSFKKWPTSFYGIGSQSSDDYREKFTERSYDFSAEILTRFRKNFYLGGEYSYRYAEIDPFEDEGQLANGDVAGANGYRVSSLGIILRLDSRNNHFFPTKGSYHTISVTGAPEWLGSSDTHVNLRIDLRQYLPLSSSQVIALQGVLESTGGTPPFRMLPSVGSTLRGYSTMRHIDRNLAAFQLEYRVVPLLWRVGFVAFAGAGDVLGHAKELAIDRLKFSAGIGIRILFSESEKVNIRYDYGFGRDSSGDYLDLNESF